MRKSKGDHKGSGKPKFMTTSRHVRNVITNQGQFVNGAKSRSESISVSEIAVGDG